MIYSLNQIKEGELFPPACESDRIIKCILNERLFGGSHYDPNNNHHIYEASLRRILSNHFDEETCDGLEIPTAFSVLLNYQKLISLKKADLVAGEPPEITGKNSDISDFIEDVSMHTDLTAKLYQTVIDMSRYGDAIWRVYKDEATGKGNFLVWSPQNWFPVMYSDGTNRIKEHVLWWYVGPAENRELRMQIHPTSGGHYIYRRYRCTDNGFAKHQLACTLGKIFEEKKIETGLDICAITHIPHIQTSSSVYGQDDYMEIDSILCEIMTRVSQISKILDKHAHPSMTGPTSMLATDSKTGERYLKTDKFYAVNPDETQPKYLTWDGHLDSSFKEIDLLLKQLFTLSEMGSAIFDSTESTGQAISGTAMRAKLASPLMVARRIATALTYPLKNLVSSLAKITNDSSTELEAKLISIEWNDGLPSDPREDAELAKLLTGENSIMPLEDAIVEYLHKSTAEAKSWIDKLIEQRTLLPDNAGGSKVVADLNQSNGSDLGLNTFTGLNNK